MVRDRKWKLAKWGMGMGTAIAGAGVFGWFFGFDGASGVLGQGLGLITLVLGMYNTANVAQKRGTSNTNSLGGKNGGENE